MRTQSDILADRSSWFDVRVVPSAHPGSKGWSVVLRIDGDYTDHETALEMADWFAGLLSVRCTWSGATGPVTGWGARSGSLRSLSRALRSFERSVKPSARGRVRADDFLSRARGFSWNLSSAATCILAIRTQPRHHPRADLGACGAPHKARCIPPIVMVFGLCPRCQRTDQEDR